MKILFLNVFFVLLLSNIGFAETGMNAINFDIAEAVFFYQIEHNDASQSNACAYFIEIAGKDPDDSFMKRFEGHHPPVKKRSECSTEGKQVSDRDTGKLGILFSVERTYLTGKDTAEAKGGYYENGLSASGDTYFLKLVNSKWVVEKERNDWISNNLPNNIFEWTTSYVALRSHPTNSKICQ